MRATQSIKQLIEEALERFRLPASRIDDQLLPSSLPPGGPGGTGYPTAPMDHTKITDFTAAVTDVVGGLGGFTDPTTDPGDMIYRDSSGIAALPIGTDDQVLTVASGSPVWADPVSGSIMDAIMLAMVANTDPIDTLVSTGTFRALIYLSSHNAATWKPASTSYTVPSGKTFLLLATWPSGLVATDSSNRRARLVNTGTSAVVLDYPAFIGGASLAWSGDLATASKFPALVAGTAIRLEIWSADTNKRAAGAVVLGVEV